MFGCSRNLSHEVHMATILKIKRKNDTAHRVEFMVNGKKAGSSDRRFPVRSGLQLRAKIASATHPIVTSCHQLFSQNILDLGKCAD